MAKDRTRGTASGSELRLPTTTSDHYNPFQPSEETRQRHVKAVIDRNPTANSVSSLPAPLTAGFSHLSASVEARQRARHQVTQVPNTQLGLTDGRITGQIQQTVGDQAGQRTGNALAYRSNITSSARPPTTYLAYHNDAVSASYQARQHSGYELADRTAVAPAATRSTAPRSNYYGSVVASDQSRVRAGNAYYNNSYTNNYAGSSPAARVTDGAFGAVVGIGALAVYWAYGKGNTCDMEDLFPSFRKQDTPKDFFRTGRVFEMLWPEPEGMTRDYIPRFEPAVTRGRHGEQLLSEVRMLCSD